MMPPPPASPAEISRSVRVLAAWGAGVGVGVLVLVAFVIVSSYTVFSRGDELSGPSDGSMFHGGEVFFAWLVGNMAAGFGILVLGVAALVLDITVLVKTNRLRSHGLAGTTARPLVIAVVAGAGWVSTPALLLLMLLPNLILGPGSATNTVLIAMIAVMFLVPVGGRIAQVICARRLYRELGTDGAGPPITPAPRYW